MCAQPAKARLGLKSFAVLAAVVLAAVFLILYSLRPTARVVAVSRGHADDARHGSVTVEARHELDLNTEVGGRVIKSLVDVGKAFKEGDFMAQIDTGDIDLAIETAQNTYDTLKSRIAVGSSIELQIETAAANLANDERLNKMGQVSDVALATERRSLQALQQSLELEKVNNESQLRTDAIDIKSKKRQKEKMTIMAPFDGVVSAVQALPGSLIPGGSGIAHFLTNDCTVEARISEENFAGIAVGDKATVIFLGYDSAKPFDATVTKILPTAESTTQRYVVYLDVKIPPERLKPGMTGEVSILVGTDPWALLAPRRALAGDKLLVVSGGRVEVRTVKTGFVGLNKVQILDGVKEGDLVIAEDLDQFHPGERVRTDILAN